MTCPFRTQTTSTTMKGHKNVATAAVSRSGSRLRSSKSNEVWRLSNFRNYVIKPRYR